MLEYLFLNSTFLGDLVLMISLENGDSVSAGSVIVFRGESKRGMSYMLEVLVAPFVLSALADNHFILDIGCPIVFRNIKGQK